MNGPNGENTVSEKEPVPSSDAEPSLTPEELARRKWEQREQKRKGKKKTKQEESSATLEPVTGPMADLMQSLVAELNEMEATDEESSEQRQTEQADEQELTRKLQETVDSEEPATKQAEVPTEAETEKRSMLEQQGTVHINVEEALAALSQEEQEEIPDIRIPEIYSRVKYVPRDSQKWAKEAARDVENDWEGFDPDNEDWTEEEEKPHYFVRLLIGIVLLIAVLLAMHAYFTSDLTGGIGMTVGSI